MPSDAFDTAFDRYAQQAGLAAAGVDLAALKTFILDEALPKCRVPDTLQGLRDDLAAIEHERWGHWQRYQHSQCRANPQEPGSLIIPSPLVAQWERQADRPFAELTADEQDSDREQVDRYLPFLPDRLSR